MRTECLLAATAAILMAVATPATAETWTCSARGMVSGNYNGGSSAYIHLEGFSRGGSYPVTKKGKVATGRTKNGTKFTCRTRH